MNQFFSHLPSTAWMSSVTHIRKQSWYYKAPHRSWFFFIAILKIEVGFAGGTRGKESSCQCRRHKKHGFSPRDGKTPWRRAWQPSAVFLPGESHGQRSRLWSTGSCRAGHDCSDFACSHSWLTTLYSFQVCISWFSYMHTRISSDSFPHRLLQNTE